MAKKYNLLAILISITGFFIGVLLFYHLPLQPDALWQYQQALTGIYSDWHPVMMAWWWHVLNKCHPGPLLYLIQNQFFYWTSFLIFYFTFSPRYKKWALLFPVLGFWPAIFIKSGDILKDIVLPSCLSLPISPFFISVKKNILCKSAIATGFNFFCCFRQN